MSFRYLLLNLFILVAALKAHAQELPDSVALIKEEYIRQYNYFNQTDSLYKTIRNTFIKNGDLYESADIGIENYRIASILKELRDPGVYSNSLSKYKIDTNWIKQHPVELLKLSGELKNYAWNKQKTELIHKKMVNIKYYEESLDDFLREGCCYTMHSSWRYRFILKLYNRNRVTVQLTSRMQRDSYLFPWTDSKDNILYSHKIDRLVNDFNGTPGNTRKPPTGNNLLRMLSKRVVARNYIELQKFAPYTYEREINELRDTFKVISFKEHTGYGSYFGEGPQIEVVLHNNTMLPNLNINFIATESNRTIYTRDSLIRNYKKYLGRIQNIKYLTDHLKANPRDTLSILFFNDKPINGYNIKVVNRDPTEWKKFDERMDMYEWGKKHGFETSEESMELSEHLYCGCGYKFDKEYVARAITFMMDGPDGSSRWLLLPDDTLLMFYASGDKVMGHDLKEFGKKSIYDVPCLRYDADGKLISRARKW